MQGMSQGPLFYGMARFVLNLGDMRGFLIKKNLSFYFWLTKKIGEKWAFRVADSIENTILLFGRGAMPNSRRSKLSD